MSTLKKIEKQRRKAAHRAAVAIVQMQEAFQAKWALERQIEEIRRKKNPTGVWLQIAEIKAGIEELGRVAMRNRAASVNGGRAEK